MRVATYFGACRQRNAARADAMLNGLWKIWKLSKNNINASALLRVMNIRKSEKLYAWELCYNSFTYKIMRAPSQNACAYLLEKSHSRGSMWQGLRTKWRPHKYVTRPSHSIHSHKQNIMHIYSREKPYTCELCDKSFIDKSTLTKQMRIYKCTEKDVFTCGNVNKHVVIFYAPRNFFRGEHIAS